MAERAPVPTAQPDASPADAAASGVAIRISDVGKEFPHATGSTVALSGVDLTVAEGEFVCLVGASGCGKSTLLNLVAGLDRPTSGTIDTGGRRIAFMFQDASLFPWLSLAKNIELPLKLRGVPAEQRRERVQELLELVKLGGRGDNRPHELSGGMRQRGALARVLAQDAQIVLMDEPFAALDAMTRDHMHDEVERIWSTHGLTVLFVTHNVREAVRLGDRAILMSSGPGRVSSEFPIDLERPRHLDDPRVAEQSGVLTRALKSEVSRHVG